MQQSLLPRERPRSPASRSARSTSRRRRSTSAATSSTSSSWPTAASRSCSGDVTGHGIDATADMAMAKFVFRSLAREHPEPSEFLAHANDVVVGRDRARQVHHDGVPHRRSGRRGSLRERRASASRASSHAGRHASRRSTAAGSRSGSTTSRSTSRCGRSCRPGGAVVLYTDGVVEARTRSRAVRHRAARRRARRARGRPRAGDRRRGARGVSRVRRRRARRRLRDRRDHAGRREPAAAPNGRPLVIGHRGAARGRAGEHARRVRRRRSRRARTSSSSTSRPGLRSRTPQPRRPARRVTLDAALEYLRGAWRRRAPRREAARVRGRGRRRRSAGTGSSSGRVVLDGVRRVVSRRLAALAPDAAARDRLSARPPRRLALRWPAVVTRSGAAALRAVDAAADPAAAPRSRAPTVSRCTTRSARAPPSRPPTGAAPRCSPGRRTTRRRAPARRSSGVDAIVSDDPEMALATLLHCAVKRLLASVCSCSGSWPPECSRAP